MALDREKIKQSFLKKYKNKIKKDVLEKHIDGLVDEFIENRNFVKDNKLRVNTLPTKDEINSWFEEPFDIENFLKTEENPEDGMTKIDLENIYLKDSLAKDVFKFFYKHKWVITEEPHPILKQFVKLYKIAQNTPNKHNKNFILSRLINICLLGTIRFYKMERKPYLRESQVVEVINHFFELLEIISKIDEKKIKDIPNEYVYIFKSLKSLDDVKSEDD